MKTLHKKIQETILEAEKLKAHHDAQAEKLWETRSEGEGGCKLTYISHLDKVQELYDFITVLKAFSQDMPLPRKIAIHPAMENSVQQIIRLAEKSQKRYAREAARVWEDDQGTGMPMAQEVPLGKINRLTLFIMLLNG